MRTLEVTNGDLVFDSNMELRMVDGVDEKVQSVEILLGTPQGQYFLNTRHGLNYDPLLVKQPDLERVRAEILRAFRQSPRIEEVLELDVEFDREERRLYADFKIRMEGDTVVEREGVELIG